MSNGLLGKEFDMSEVCKHGLAPEQCNYCREKTPPTRPQGFSTRIEQYLGNPTLEILVNGKPWGDVYHYDEHFRFGLHKAKLIFCFFDIIEEFVKSNGKRPPFNTPLKRVEPSVNLYSQCICTNFPAFIYSNKRQIDQPYLKLECDQLTIGFGTIKAQALIEVRDRIEDFINSH